MRGRDDTNAGWAFPLAGSGHSPEGGAASSTASPAKPSVPNADERLAELLALEENWNSYRAKPIDPAVAERVRAVFPLMDKLGLNPWITPDTDGGLQIERAGTDDYSVEFRPDGTAAVYFEGLSDKDALGMVSQFALLKALDRTASAMSAGTAETPQSGSGLQPASAVGTAETPTPRYPGASNAG